MNKQQLAEKYKHLFWYFDKSKLSKMSEAVLIEFILNYGDMADFKQVIKILGIKKTAQIFDKEYKQKRSNFKPKIANYFKLYFKKYASRSLN